LFDDDDAFMRDFSELADLYERLCQKMRSVNVRVLTANKELCSVGYGELLVPGTVVKAEGRKYFYCGERNANELESSWAGLLTMVLLLTCSGSCAAYLNLIGPLRLF
jgi:hypothetical protein